MTAIFKTTGPLGFDQDREIYVERPELDLILRETRKPSVESYLALLGSRQTGKTTLLFRLYRELKGQGEAVAFLDLSTYRVENPSQSYAHASIKIWEELIDALGTPGKLRAVASAANGPIRFREFMLELARQCHAARIVILLDEVGSFVSNMGFFETLRSILSSGVHDSEQAFRKYLFVFSGAVDLHELTTSKSSPLANVCKPIYLEDFDFAGTRDLVRNLAKIAPVDANIAAYIHYHTRGHPYLTQRLCALIETERRAEGEADEQGPTPSQGQRAGRRITPQDVDRAIDQLNEGDQNLRYVALQLDKEPEASKLLHRMLAEKLVVPFSTLDPRVARLFVIGAVRRDKDIEKVRGILRERSRCVIRNPIYERALSGYFDMLDLTASRSGGLRTEEWLVPQPADELAHMPEQPILTLPPAVDPRDYLDFHLRISAPPAADQPFPLIVDSWAGRGKGQVDLDVASPALRQQIERLERYQAAPDDLYVLGEALWQALFSPADVAQRYAACQAESGTRKGIRLKLDIEPAELCALPWEYLYDPQSQTFPALSPRTPITRYTSPEQRLPPPLSFEPPLRILLVSAEPTDQGMVGTEGERAQIVQAMARLQDAGKVLVESLEHATVGRLQAALRRPFHVLHFVGHGAYDERTGNGALILEDAQRATRAISAMQLHYLLRDTTVRLAVLNACMTAHGPAGRSVASELMQAGLSATLAMQFAVPIDSATTFAGEFYRALADGWPVDAAVAEGRKAVMFATDLNVMDWGIPALFMRTRDGILFRRRT